MKVFHGICLRDWTIEGVDHDQPAGPQVVTVTLRRGQEYTISAPLPDGAVVVFTRYWLRVPADVFGGVIPL